MQSLGRSEHAQDRSGTGPILTGRSAGNDGFRVPRSSKKGEAVCMEEYKPLRVAGARTERPQGMLDPFLRPAKIRQDYAEMRMGQCEVRIEFDGLHQAGQSPRDAAVSMM